MAQFAFTAPQTGINLAKALGLSELAKKHRYKVIPAGKTFAALLATGLANSMREMFSINERKQLAEQT